MFPCLRLTQKVKLLFVYGCQYLLLLKNYVSRFKIDTESAAAVSLWMSSDVHQQLIQSTLSLPVQRGTQTGAGEVPWLGTPVLPGLVPPGHRGSGGSSS